jgi:hypothetical protein
LFDKRTPGLFKVEYEGDGIIALGSKMYYCFGEKDKVRYKGINKQQNAVTKQRFEAALYGNSTQGFYNTQLKVCDNRLTLYKQYISGLKLFNDKRIRQGFETKLWKFNISSTDIKEMADTENIRETLRKIYYDPKTGFISAQKLYLKLNKTIPLTVIQRFLDEQEIYQISKEVRAKYPFRHMIVYSSNDQWQIDLIDFSKYSRWNKGFKYLHCAVDVYSRKAFVVPIKSKTFTTDAMNSILNIAKPILIQSDNGSELLNKSFQALLKSFKVQHTTAQVGDHNRQGIIERFNRTIEAMIAKYQESRKKTDISTFWMI